MQYIVPCTRRSGKGSNNQFTEVETNYVIQPSLLCSALLWLPAAPHLLGNPYFWKTKMAAETAGFWRSDEGVQSERRASLQITRQ